jgi:Raf kinase inhibitor-like YbhB/YbcL family protein
MKIESPAFENNQSIPSKYTCDGENVNPPLKISQMPKEAKSLVLVFDDPDAPAGTWVHWTIWNIDPQTEEIAEASVPQNAVEGKTSFGRPGYGGPCPPSGTHRYFFKLYALDTVLNLDSSAKIKDIESAMEGHVLARAELMGLYKRQ